MDHTSILRNVSLFKNLSPQLLKGLGKSCTERRYKSGDVLVHQGNPGVGLFIIVRGRVRIEKTTDDGNRISLATHGPGEVIGEMAVLDGASRTADVIAEEDTECLVLASWAFNSFMEAHPKVALHVLPLVVARFRETNNALIKLRSMTKK